jgi:hypothetical protein
MQGSAMRRPLSSLRESLTSHADAVRILDVLDAALALGSYAQVTLFADRYGDGVAERVFRSWAAANALEVHDRAHCYPDKTIRSIEAGGNASAHIVLLWPPQAVVHAKDG